MKKLIQQQYILRLVGFSIDFLLSERLNADTMTVDAALFSTTVFWIMITAAYVQISIMIPGMPARIRIQEAQTIFGYSKHREHPCYIGYQKQSDKKSSFCLIAHLLNTLNMVI